MTLGLATMNWPTLSEAGAYRVRDANVYETEPTVGPESTEAEFAHCLVEKTSCPAFMSKDLHREFAEIPSIDRSVRRRFTMSDSAVATRTGFEIGLKADLHSVVREAGPCVEEFRIGLACGQVAEQPRGTLLGVSEFASLHGPDAPESDVLTSATNSDCQFTFGDYERLASSSKVGTNEPVRQFDWDAESIVVLTHMPDRLSFFLSLIDLACAGSGFLHRMRRKNA